MRIILGKLLGVLIVVSAFILGGCVSYITPKLGSIAKEDAVFSLDSLSGEPQKWETGELSVTVSTLKTDTGLELSGEIFFSNRLQNSFNRIEKLNIIISFVDTQHQVLSSVDITPMFMMAGLVPNKAKYQTSVQVPPGSEGIVLNYYGVFHGDDPGMGSSEIFYRPYN